MSATSPTNIVLAMKSRNICAFKECREALTVDGFNANSAVIGEAKCNE